ncbi:MAG: DsbA family protein [Gemmatimonadaceae bacterium]
MKAISLGVLLGDLLMASCSSSPSPEQLQETLVKNPQVVYAVIQAHPAEFLDVLNRAAQQTQASQHVRALQADSSRIEEELRNPKRPVIQQRAVLGNPAAPITVVEYTDFECPYCRQERDVLVQLMKQYGDRVRLVVKQMPVVELHPRAMAAALMFEAIARQDPMKAYRFYDDVYANQERLTQDGQRFLEDVARRAGADVERAVRDQNSEAIRAVVAADMDEGKRFGFTGTPGFSINGVTLQGAHPLSAFTSIIDRELSVSVRR